MNRKAGEKFSYDIPLSRRKILELFARTVSMFAAFPLFSTIVRSLAPDKKTHPSIGGLEAATVKQRNAGVGGILLAGGLIVDGTGSGGFKGSLLMNGGVIKGIFHEGADIPAVKNTINCTGRVIAPGFIDSHSHMDMYMPIKNGGDLKSRFTGQGITTFIGGNCGFGPAGYKKNSSHMDRIETRTKEYYKVSWATMSEYFSSVKKSGLSHNLATYVGHGTTRASIRGFDSSPLKPEEMKEMLRLLEDAMDQGAIGVSLGLQYEPGIFADRGELLEVARLVKRKNKVLAAHMRAYSALAPGYPMSTGKILIDYLTPFEGYTPHNLLAIDEMISIARETGVRLQMSHLIFVGKQTFKNCDDALERIDKAIKQGVDVRFDTYSYHCGQSHINVVLPPWFLAKVPGAYGDKKMLNKLKSELGLIQRFLGFGYNDIQITYANHPDMNKYNGMFLGEIAQKRGMDWFESTMDLANKSGGVAEVLNHRYSSMEIIEELMKHPASLFMTDALPTLKGVQNPAGSGSFARFLQIARDRRLISLEEAVYKMSGASVERFSLKNRGLLKEGYAADITVFDWKTVKDNNTITETSKSPSGIEAVFINGRPALVNGKPDGLLQAGMVCV